MDQRGRALVACCVLVFATAGVSTAQGLDGLTGVARTQSAHTLGGGRISTGLDAECEQSSGYVKGPTWNIDNVVPDDKSIESVLQEPATVVTSDFYLALGILDFWDLAASLPLYYDWSGFGPSDAGIGDLEVISKFEIRRLALGKIFFPAVSISATLPTGTRGNGLFPRLFNFTADTGINPTSDLYTADYVTVKPLLILTFDFGKRAPLRLHANFGGVVAETNNENSLFGSLAIEYAPTDFVTLFAEVSAQPRWTSLAVDHNFRKDPVWATPGVRVSAPGGLYFCLAGDFSLSSKQQRYNWHQKGFSYSTGIQPDYGIRFIFGWSGFVTTQDRDHDGVPDNIDRCPDDSGPASNYGCPEPDADRDGVCDPWVSQKHKESQYSVVCKGVDKCPTKPEDVDGFQDDDGCPDLDNDGDGIPDSKDLCPNEPEDFDGFQDNDGCPDFDNDHDGIPDSIDKCPNEPEDLDGFEDNDGCPDLDNDRDGIPDLQDKCPNEPGPASNNGCPEPAPAHVPPKKEPNLPAQQILRGVTFVNNTAEMTFESFQWLDAIVKTMKEFPSVEIEVRCYADGTSKRPPPMQLTQSRAESVRQYIAAQGVDSGRIRAAGYGSANPIADNRTAAGRALNRRIEIVRTK